MKPVHINFLTTNKKSSKKTIVLLLILLICATGLTGGDVYTFYAQKKTIDQYRIKARHYTSGSKKEKPLSPAAMGELKSDIFFLNTLLQDKAFSWIDILNRIESSIDDGVRFTEMKIDRDNKKILLSGRGNSAEDLSLFIKRISSDNRFSLNSLSQESRQDSIIHFDMGMTIKK